MLKSVAILKVQVCGIMHLINGSGREVSLCIYLDMWQLDTHEIKIGCQHSQHWEDGIHMSVCSLK